MKLLLSCPSCSRSLAVPHGTEAAIDCPSCGSQFGRLYGKLSKRISMPETLLYLTAKLPRLDKRHYLLQVTTPDRTLKQLQFSIPGASDRVPVQAGDLVSVLYTLRGAVLQNLVAITNHTTGQQYLLPSPIPSWSRLAPQAGMVLVGLLLLARWSGASLVWVGVIGLLSLLLYLKLTDLARLSSPDLKTQGQDGLRLLADQRLWRQRLRIEQRIQELEHDSQTNRLLISQLEALKHKMARLDASLYAARMLRATSAIHLIAQQVANNQRLVCEYRHTLKMIEIEMDTSWVAEQLPAGNEFMHRILHKLEELKAIEAQNQALQLQLAAYDELSHRIA